MKAINILIALALLVPLVASASAPIIEAHLGGEGQIVQAASAARALDTPTASEKVFVGSIKSNKYHYPDCRAAKRIAPGNEIWFSSSADARAHGYVPCGICNPP